MKVLLVSRCSWTFHNFRAGLAKELLARKIEVVGGGAGGDHYEKKIVSIGIPFKDLPVDLRGVNPLADLRLIYALYCWYRAERPDVVHHFTIKPVIYGSIAARFAGVPRIVNTITGLGYVYTERKGVLRLLVDRLYRLALGFAHHVFFQNEDDRALFVQNALVDSRKTAIVPGSGVDTQKFSVDTQERSRVLAAQDVVVLMSSRLLRDKGIYEFVDAARIVARSAPSVKFQILGEIDTRNPTAVSPDEVKAWEQEGVVRWLRHTDDVRPFVAASDIVVLPSYREGTPKSLLEAAAMGKPVIATNVTGCREVVDDGITGLLVPVRDAFRLADAILKLARDPELRLRMGAAGRKKIEATYDERYVIEAAIQSYTGVA